ncbi:RDD family protein [Bacillus sp. 4A_MP2]
MDSTFDEVTESRSQEGESRPTLAKRTSIEAQAFAGFWIRFWAFILDWLVVWGVNHLTVSPIFSLFGWSKGGGWFSPFSVTTTIVFLLYFAIMTKIFQQTLGKMVFGIKVVSLQPEKKLPWMSFSLEKLWGDILIRFLFSMLWLGSRRKSKGFMTTLQIRWLFMNIYMKNRIKRITKESLAGYRSNSFLGDWV